MGTNRTLLGLGAAVLLGVGVQAQVTQRLSLATDGAQGNGLSGTYGISTSADGRWVAFSSLAGNLVPGDTNGYGDVFVRDRVTGTTERVSLSSTGAQGNAQHLAPSISADGRFVAFASDSLRLVPGDTNWRADIFVRDRLSGTTERVSVDSSGAEVFDNSYTPSISADGRFVAFASLAETLVADDTNFSPDVFVHDRQLGTTERVSVDSGGLQGNWESWYPEISADGRFVVFISLASNLTLDDTNAAWDVFVHDRSTGVTERVSVGSQGGGGGYFLAPSISADGRYVAFKSGAGDLVPGDTFYQDIFVRDRSSGTTERVSVDSGGMEANGDSFDLSISADGRYVAFTSFASNLVPGDTNGKGDVFLRDRQSGTTERMNVGPGGVQANGDSWLNPSISADGRHVAFESIATNLVPVDTNATVDVFLRDRFGGPSFTSLCHPGVAGVSICPCSNPPSGPGRGCDNSSGTGGAILSASGGTYLSSDSLVFTTSGERPAALSIVTQWIGLNPSGAIFGMGVRCTSGGFKRMYTKAASGGSITAPDFGSGDATVSARSSMLGDPIQPGQERRYLVYYRDPIVLGGCPATSTFNATQTGQVAWRP